MSKKPRRRRLPILLLISEDEPGRMHIISLILLYAWHYAARAYIVIGISESYISVNLVILQTWTQNSRVGSAHMCRPQERSNTFKSGLMLRLQWRQAFSTPTTRTGQREAPMTLIRLAQEWCTGSRPLRHPGLITNPLNVDWSLTNVDVWVFPLSFDDQRGE